MRDYLRTRERSAERAKKTEDPKEVVRLVRGGWVHQAAALRKLAIIVYLPAVLLLSVALVQSKVPVTSLFRDLDSVANVPFYTAFYSQLGAVFWASAAAICVFSWAVLRSIRDSAEWQWFFLSAGAFTALLLFDDLFLFHEEILPKLFRYASTLMYLFYAAGALAFVIRFRQLLLTTNYLVLLVGLAFLGLSLVIDEATEMLIAQEAPEFTRYRIVVEDGAKFLGILGWLTYFASVAAGRFGHLMRKRPVVSENGRRVSALK